MRWRRPLVVMLCTILAAGLGVMACAGAADRPDCAATAGTGRVGGSDGSGMSTMSDDDLGRVLTAAREAGMWSIRVDIDWSLVEPVAGQRDWSAMDRVVRAVADHGMCALGLVTYTPAWAAVEHAGPLDSRFRPRDPAVFADFAGAAAQRYREDIAVWEVWNEPNNVDFFKPAPDAALYGALLSASYPAIKSANPDATVLSGGLAPAEDDGGHIAPVTFLAALYDGGVNRFLDAFAIHPYSYPALPDAPDTGHWNTAQQLTVMRDVMVDGGDADKPIWITEFGAPTGTGEGAVSEATQARTIEIILSMARDTPWLGPAFVYSVRDGGIDVGDIEQNFGIIRNDFSEKPAYDVVSRFGNTPG